VPTAPHSWISAPDLLFREPQTEARTFSDGTFGFDRSVVAVSNLLCDGKPQPVFRMMSGQQVVLFANDRCHQENTIAQLKSGVNALRLPTSDFHGNWAYMVIATLAWNLKACYGLLAPNKASRREILRMEFKRFLRSFLQIPCQIVKTGRRLVYRVLCYQPHLATFLATFGAIGQSKFT
jgi:hypothetical protein